MPTKTKGARYVPSYLDASGGPEPCVVCGDEASGLHYRVMTCEGCKGFFRRTIQKGLEYECKGRPLGSCPVAKGTRNHCQDCRFRKALSVGMAKDLVLSEQARQAKRALIEENRERRSLETLQAALKSIRAAEEGSVLSDQDVHLLQSLTQSFHNFHSAPVTMSADVSEGGVVPHIQRVVSFAESFSAFLSLSREDRICLVRGSWLELLVLSVCLGYGDGELRLPSGRVLRGDDAPPHLAALFHLARLLGGLELDSTEVGVAAGLLLLNPERAGLAEALHVESAQDQLLTALARYQPRDHAKLLLAIVQFRAECAVANEELGVKGHLPLLDELIPSPSDLSL